MSTTIIPDAIHICEQCGDLASGTCGTCAAISRMAQTVAAAVLASGKPLSFDPDVTPDGVELEWRAAVTVAYHRQRAAQLYGSLARVEGASPRRLREPEWMLHLRGWITGIFGIAGSWVLLALAATAFWCAGKIELHYDLVPGRRMRAVELGAVQHDRYQMVEFMRRRRVAELTPSLFGEAS